MEAIGSSTARSWRSPLIGERREIEVPGGRLEAFVRGTGPAIVFAHGWLSNANLWRGVVDRLSGRFTCVALDLPLGAHRRPIPGADLSPAGCGGIILASIEALGLEEVTLVGNDSGGAYSQIAVASDRERVARLVLNGCETPFDEFPPPPFDGLPSAAQDVEGLGNLLGALRDPAVREAPAAFGLLAKHGLERPASDSYALPCAEDPAIVADAARAMSSAGSPPVHAAGRELIASFDSPVLLLWAPEDEVFPIANARRYAAELAAAELVEVADAYSFMAEDQPGAVADVIARFAAP